MRHVHCESCNKPIYGNHVMGRGWYCPICWHEKKIRERLTRKIKAAKLRSVRNAMCGAKREG